MGAEHLRPLAEIVILTDGRALTPLPRHIAAEHVPGAPRAWRTRDGLRIIAGDEPYLEGRFGALRHVSFSRADRLPGWREVKIIKATFYGDDAEAMIVLPRAVDYTNLHTTTHHLWQIPEPWTDIGPVAW